MIKNNIKYVIARTIGPMYNGSGEGCLTIGKAYEVNNISYQVKDSFGYWMWVDDVLKYNPDQPKFYIEIKQDDHGKIHSIWNDYFYSTKEMRELVIDEILEL